MRSVVRRARVLVGVPLGVPVVLGAAGCGTGGSPGEPALGPIQHITSYSQVHLPLARYGLTSAEQQAIFEGVRQAQRDCALSFGVDAAFPVTPQPTEIENDTLLRYGVLDPALAARYGYSSGAAPTGPDPGKSQAPPESATARLVLTGTSPDGTPFTGTVAGRRVPKGGCAAEGERRVTNTNRPLDEFVGGLLGQAWELLVNDSRMAAASARWAACMAKHGYTFRHRWDAGNSMTGTDKAAEIAMAELDLGCATRTNYVGTLYAIDTAYQNRLIADHEAELQAVLADHRRMLDSARSVLQGGR